MNYSYLCITKLEYMEQEEKIILQKVRSYRGILSAGTHLYISAFRRFLKASWLTALIYALINAALGTLTAIKVPELIVVILQQLQRYNGVFIESLQSYLVILVACIVLILAAVIAAALSQATIFALLKEHSETGNVPVPDSWWKPSTRMMGRTLKGVLLTLLICIPMVILAIATSYILSLWYVQLIFLAITAPFALPLWYVLLKYIMEPSAGYWATVRKGYGRGMGHWGSLFLILFLTTLFILLAGMIVMLPAHILYLANYRAQMGVLIGDPLGMPSYMLPMTFITFVLCSFLYFYICLPMLFNGYYAYGSIEAKELEHEQQKLNIQ